MYNKEINELVYKFATQGLGNSSDGAIMIGKAPFVGPKAYVNIIYPVLNVDEILQLEKELDTSLPIEYKEFLMNYSNGVHILFATMSLYGLRRHMTRDPKENSRQPYSIITSNVHERPENAMDNYFFIGGYNWDGSRLYIDKKTNKVHCCERWDATSRIEWNSFQEMLLSELKRLYLFFDDEGREIDEDNSTLPYL